MKTIAVELPVSVRERESGRLFLTCPLIPGLLVSGHTVEELLGKAQEAVLALSLATTSPD